MNKTYGSIMNVAKKAILPIAMAGAIGYASPARAELPIYQETRDIITYGSLEAKMAHDDSVAQAATARDKAIADELDRQWTIYQEMKPQLDSIVKDFNLAIADGKFTRNEQEGIYHRMHDLRVKYNSDFDAGTPEEKLYETLDRKVSCIRSYDPVAGQLEQNGLQVEVQYWIDPITQKSINLGTMLVGLIGAAYAVGIARFTISEGKRLVRKYKSRKNKKSDHDETEEA